MDLGDLLEVIVVYFVLVVLFWGGGLERGCWLEVVKRQTKG